MSFGQIPLYSVTADRREREYVCFPLVGQDSASLVMVTCCVSVTILLPFRQGWPEFESHWGCIVM